MDLSNLAIVTMSEWTLEYFLEPPLADGTLFVQPDTELHAAITALVETWQRVELPAISAVEWRKPEGVGDV